MQLFFSALVLQVVSNGAEFLLRPFYAGFFRFIAKQIIKLGFNY